MGAVVSMLWPKNGEVLNHYLQRVPSNVYTFDTVLSILPQEERDAICADARDRANAIEADFALNADARVPLLTAGLSKKLARSMMLVRGLDHVHERDGIELVVLNEDVSQLCRIAADWAKVRGLPSVCVSHSTILGRLYTVHRDLHAEYATVFGQRGAQPYLSEGVNARRLAITGNPAWDVYADLVAQRPQIRASLAQRHGFEERDHVVVFATTWPAYFTAFCDGGQYERSLRAVLHSIAELRQLGVPLRLVIKERPSNQTRRGVLDAVLAQEPSVPVIVTHDDLPNWIVAANAVISIDSNVSVEAMIAGTPAINLWSPESWLNGPFFGAEDGVLEVSEQDLSVGLARALGDPDLRSQLVSRGRAMLAEFAPALGSAAVGTAEFLQRVRLPQGNARYVWQELSDPRGVKEKGKDSVYYRSPRLDMLKHLNHDPRVVLDVGCGAGATGAELKRRYPSVTAIGIEFNEHAAQLASTQIDRVISANVETLDFNAAGLEEGSLDLVLFPDVLEHLYDPWRVLVRLRPFLSANAQILASIPNVRNLWLMGQLASGTWQYEEDGLLDVTHIRFFTKKSVLELFQQTGYAVKALHVNIDGRVPAMQAAPGTTVNIETPRLTLKNLTQEDLNELRALQFIVDASVNATHR